MSASAADRLYLIADFNAETFARYFANTACPGAQVDVAPLGQVMQALSAPPPHPRASAFVWTQPNAVIPGFDAIQRFEAVPHADILAAVTGYAQRLLQFARSVDNLFVASWVIPPWMRGYDMLDFRPNVGVAHLMAAMNLRLAQELAPAPNVFVLDAARWLLAKPGRGMSAKLWYASKTPFAAEVIGEAADDLAAALRGLSGGARRIVILDLDNVLWGGVVGDVGWEHVVLGGHDMEGEAYLDFQRALKALTRRGVQLAIVSKNDERTALEAIERHPEMQLRLDDFAGWRINWEDKARNVADLLASVRLGAASAVFIDDNPVERARVASALPEVLVPEWPADPARYREALGFLRAFDSPSLTDEDRRRSANYAADRARTAEQQVAIDDLPAWLRSLNIVVTEEPLTMANSERAAQLFNKTNQMNMTTRRLSRQELAEWAAQPAHTLLTFRVTDRFGDSGLTGIAGGVVEGETFRMTDFLVSCRVLGRNVEQTMLGAVIDRARAAGAKRVVATFVPTDRNRPCFEFLQGSGFATADGRIFTWDVSRPYPQPDWVTLQRVSR